MSESDQEYDGPQLGEVIKFSIGVGPEQAVGVIPMDNGGIYVTPETAYQVQNAEWVDLEMDAEPIFRAIAAYVNPQEIRQRRNRQSGGNV